MFVAAEPASEENTLDTIGQWLRGLSNEVHSVDINKSVYNIISIFTKSIYDFDLLF